MAQPTVEPITSATLPAFCAFLQHNMPVARSAADWERGLRNQWMPQPPNFGFMLRSDAGAVVGGIGAYYANRTIRGNHEKFCNITSWCVLDAHRQLSMKLAMAVISQPGYTFTDFSPTKVVAGTLKFFKFKEIDESQAVVLNVPGVAASGGRVLHKPPDIEAALIGNDLDIYQSMPSFLGCAMLSSGTQGNWCHVIYKRITFKGLPAADVLYVGNRQAFARHFRSLATFLLARRMVTTHVECRIVDGLPWPHKVRTGFIRKVYLSTLLGESDIDYLYSERIALDL